MPMRALIKSVGRKFLEAPALIFIFIYFIILYYIKLYYIMILVLYSHHHRHKTPCIATGTAG